MVVVMVLFSYSAAIPRGNLKVDLVKAQLIPGHRMPEGSRRFPPPWRADRTPHGYVVRDANGQELAYSYSRENEVEALQAKVLTKDEARRIAVNIARLPELQGRARLNGQPAVER
jgi:hypothetical protein